MPWQEVSIMDQRVEFVALMRAAGANRSELCRRFGVSSKTGYKWLGRAAQGSEDWSADRSRRPHESPRRSEAALEAAVLRMRDRHPPWGDGPAQGWTKLGVWLLKLGVEILHSRPYHPQTRGKNERFHRTLKAEVLAMEILRSFAEVQAAFDRWRSIYNHKRPHQALGLEVPASRYRPSPRSMPSKLPEPEYQTGDVLRTVGATKGYISFRGQSRRVPDAFQAERVDVRPLESDGHYGIFFGARQIASFDLRDAAQESLT